MTNFHRSLVFLHKHGIKVLPTERKYTLSVLTSEELQIHEIDIESIKKHAEAMVKIERIYYDSCTQVIMQANKAGFIGGFK